MNSEELLSAGMVDVREIESVGYLRGDHIVYSIDGAGVRMDPNGLTSISNHVSQSRLVSFPPDAYMIKPTFDSELRVLLQKLHEQLPKDRDPSFYEGCSFVMGYLEDEFGTENK